MIDEYRQQLDAVRTKGDTQYREAISAALPKTVDNVYLIGCGATLSQMYPLQYMLDRNLVGATVRVLNAAEFAARKPLGVGENSVVVGSSHSGSTAETVESVRWAKERGAVVFSISANETSAMGDSSDVVLVYPDGPALSEAKLMLGFLVGTELLRSSDVYAALRSAWVQLPEAFVSAVKHAQSQAQQWVKPLVEADTVFTLGSGPSFGPAYAFAICKLMEMQWKKASPLDTVEFFHGPLEVAAADVRYVVFVSEDETRAYAERVLSFLKTYSEHVVRVDTAEFDLPLSQEVRPWVTSLMLWPAINAMAEALAEHTGHSLDVRRYMGVVKY